MTRILQTFKNGFTLIEMMIAMAVALVAFLAIGGVLVDSQRGWNKTYNDIYEGPDAQSYMIRLKFDSIVRKSIDELVAITSDQKELYVYWYDSQASTYPDRKGRFYLSGNDLLLSINGATEVICKNVQKVDFYLDEYSRTVKMILELMDENNRTNTVICGAIPQNFILGRL